MLEQAANDGAGAVQVGGLPVITDKDAMRAWSREQRRLGNTIAFVPTMGYLHEGHLSLVKAARARCDVVAASIYVNPTQFSAHEDFDVYPRQAERDRELLQQAGCSVVFEPRSLYHEPEGAGEGSNVVGREVDHADAHETYVQVEKLQRGLCGKSRPHFFRGVATVVTKLFNIVEPDVAFFGRKDYQQWRVITRMVRDLDFGLEIVGLPICREADGLAMSSRNARLSADARAKAPAIYMALQAAAASVAAGTARAPADVAAQVSAAIEAAGGKMDYVEMVNALSLRPIDDCGAQPTLLAVAALFAAGDAGTGTVRLIDNMVLGE
ncbi:hypothetical protein FOA52_014205 [Chlamydomonas sp. UWO 241]|nr:hypothetical protein FOA52_014205 [Chlamydomonas sp. UWO 241]